MPGPPRVRYVDPGGQHDAVRGALRAVAVGHDEERAAVVAAEHAGEAPAVHGHGLEDLAALGHPDAVLLGTEAYQIAPEASTQMPSGASPSPSRPRPGGPRA